jgi:drug/metabolite transporter (DMT)-like permease
MTQTRNQRIKVLLAFLAVYIIWGTTYLAAIVGLESFPPFLLSALRFTTAGIILLVVSVVRGLTFPKGKMLAFYLANGVVMLVGGSGLVTWSEQYVLSGYAAVVVACEPFIFVLLDRQRWRYYFHNRNIVIGLLIGFIGVMLFVWFSSSLEMESTSADLIFIGYTVLFVSCFLWVIGSIFSSRNQSAGTSVVAISTIQLLSAGVFSFMLAGITNEFETFHFVAVTVRSWTGLIYLTIGGSVVAYLSFVWLLTVRSPAQVSTHTYINPIVALFMGWWIVNDPINLQQILCVVVILAGVLLTSRDNNTALGE